MAKYGHYMLKEIYDEPESIRLTVKAGEKKLQKVVRTLKGIGFQRIFLVGCGSSYYSGIAGKYFIEKFAKIHSSSVPALEFVKYASTVVGAESLVICVSQSGETIETLKALRKAKEKGAYVLSLTNNGKSPLAREADLAIQTSAGTEIGPGTKTVVTQMMLLFDLALTMAGEIGKLPRERASCIISTLANEVPKTIARVLRSKDGCMRALARKYKDMRDIYIVGSGPCFPCALQVSNLIKETALIHAEAFSVEEFRHGPMEILDLDSIFIAINPLGSGRTSLLKLIERVKKIGSKVISLAGERDLDTRRLSDEFISMPRNFDEWQASFLYLPILQLFAYYLAIERNIDPDNFRNIRKTWTSE
jgi:glucosamine--fructose-6-phosphate aminotransferase (isomerizing)